MLGDDRAALDLPVKLAIFSILGLAALGMLLSQLSSLGCLVPRRILVSASTYYIRSGISTQLELMVQDSSGNPVSNVELLLRNEAGIVWHGSSDSQGRALIQIKIDSPGYLELMAIPRGCYQEYRNPRFIKILT